MNDVDGYALGLLRKQNCISSSEITIFDSYDYLMLIQLAANYNEETSPYHITFLEGTVKSNGFEIPNMRISRR